MTFQYVVLPNCNSLHGLCYIVNLLQSLFFVLDQTHISSLAKANGGITQRRFCYIEEILSHGQYCIFERRKILLSSVFWLQIYWWLFFFLSWHFHYSSYYGCLLWFCPLNRDSLLKKSKKMTSVILFGKYLLILKEKCTTRVI